MQHGDRLHDIGYLGLYYRYIGDNLDKDEDMGRNGNGKRRIVERHGP